MNTDTIGRAVALVAGVISTACALGILLEDVWLGKAAFALKHALTIGVVALAILFGHLVVEAGRARHWLGAAGFVVLFFVATGLVVYKSTGRQAEHTFASQAEADLAADERARIKPLLGKAEAMLLSAAERIEADCVKGKRGKGHCDGLRTSHAVYDAAVKGHKADLEKLGPPRPVAPEAENFAALAAVFGADKVRVKAASMLVVPFMQTALYELGGILGLWFAFRHRPATGKGTVQVRQPRQPLPAETAQTSFWADDIETTRAIVIGGPGDAGNWGNPGNGGGKRVLSKTQAFFDIKRRLREGETIASQEQLAEAWGVSPGTASKWLKAWREKGLVPAAQRVGRCHRLAAAE